MTDIVIDTCTLAHASNPQSGYQDSSLEMIDKILSSQTTLVMDETFSDIEALNTSHLGSEYYAYLSTGMVGQAFLQQMLVTGRVEFVTLSVPKNVRDKLNQLIRDKGDIKFLKVTNNSAEKTLVSNDYTDFQQPKRNLIYKELSLIIENSDEIIERL